jgi:LysM repeat protein
VKPNHILVGLTAVLATGGAVLAQDAPAGLQAGPAAVAPHWTKNTEYPTSISEGTAYYVVVRGDTLWDIAARFMKNPYLWPQIWDANKHVRDAHWIYPGDPVILPKVQVVAEQAGQAGQAGAEGPGEEEAVGGAQEVGGVHGVRPEALAGTAMAPVTEESTLRCAEYLASGSEDDSLRVMGSEHGWRRFIFAEGDIVYLNRGAKRGLKPGDVFSTHRASYEVVHPITGKKLGTKIETSGWLRVILVQDDIATAIIEHSCDDTQIGDYLKPFQPMSVPVVAQHTPADRLAPPTGKLSRHIVDVEGHRMIAGTGDFVTIDAGSEDGITPGSIFTIFRVTYPSIPSPRDVRGEVIVVSAREKSAIAKVTYSRSEILPGDRVELH